MGNTQSLNEEEAKTPSLTESHNSARNVFENIGIGIYNEEKKNVNKYASQLRGNLSRATFCDVFCDFIGIRNYPYTDPCYLDHRFYTNIKVNSIEGRNPCNGREKKRFGENAEAYCNSDKIRGNENNSNAGACAPPRRRHMCDKNLEFLDNNNTNTIHDLLGNVLVTAKYEGDIIVSNHPNTKTSDVCTALARSFADIGDIVRGRDMFKRTDKDYVENGLREVFNNIYGQLENNAKAYYSDKDKSGNYYKLREAWWNANRDQVWRAITCKAPENIHYFRKGSDGSNLFSNNGPCGRNERNVPTYLDYVPQFLRWFDEWAEEFCRKKKN
ncbi:hypothetical protein PFTANZ_06055 [Plasmodium falciparum Tanzania (2000708)]|uniref:Uncharacterized protein n=3 Tax=Plasmodium falciparum TaxID=5833 RepID=A0A024VZ88_PLAFA|nr:hypothetical protein PFTANZ_06055 [Plasmodium falciparum Tanzania (2000708)]